MPSQDQIIHAPKAPATMGAYSKAVRSGNMIYMSGWMGDDKEGNMAADIEAQVEQAYRNIQACLEDAGSSLDKIITKRVYMVDIAANLDGYRRAQAPFFKEPYAASTLVEVVRLVRKESLVEIEVMAEA